MFAGPHLECLARWRHATGRYTALAARNRRAMHVGQLTKARQRAQQEAHDLLTCGEARLWRKARQLGYENGRNVEVQQLARGGRRVSARARDGSIGGRRAGQAKHQRVYRRWCQAIGLFPRPRTADLWRRAYVLGYWRGRRSVRRRALAAAA